MPDLNEFGRHTTAPSYPAALAAWQEYAQEHAIGGPNSEATMQKAQAYVDLIRQCYEEIGAL